MKKIMFIALAVFSLAAFIIALSFQFTPESLSVLKQESGLIETLTALVFLFCSFLGLYIGLKSQNKIFFVSGALMMIAFGRELDLHKKWTSDSILKINFYEDMGVPLTEKIAGAIFIVILIGLVGALLKRVPDFIRNVLKLTTSAWCFGAALALLAFAKSLDSFSRLFPFAKDFHRGHEAQFGFVEESFELLSAGLFFTAFVISYLESQRAAR